MPSLPLLLLQIAFILGACRLLTPVFARLGQPAVMAEMTAGLLLGPSCFGWLAPDLSAFVFPDGSLPTLALISQVGLVLFMFLVGWRLDVGHLRSIGRRGFHHKPRQHHRPLLAWQFGGRGCVVRVTPLLASIRCRSRFSWARR